MIDGLIPLGYCLVHKAKAQLLPPGYPPEYMAVAGCPCEAAIPDVDNISVTPLQFDPLNLGKKWDITPENAQKLFQFNYDANARINYEMLNYFLFEDALHVRDTFFRGRGDVVLLGLGVLDQDILVNQDIRKVSPLPENGEMLGFDLYEIGDAMEESAPRHKPNYLEMTMMGLGCPIACCDEGNIAKRLGVSLNRLGLYQTADIAARAADLVNQEHLGEPVWYLPVALIRYE